MKTSLVCSRANSSVNWATASSAIERQTLVRVQDAFDADLRQVFDQLGLIGSRSRYPSSDVAACLKCMLLPSQSTTQEHD